MKSKRAREAAETAEAPANTNGADEPSLKKRKHTDDVDGAVKKSKKDKKDKKKGGETRKEKKDKRKDLQNLPDMDEPEEDEAEAVKEDKPKKDSKADTNGDESAKKKEKKEKKDKKKKEKKEKKETETKTENNNTATAPEGDSNGIDLDESTAKKNDRHIVFVGNLPFTATAATISAHFASLSPIAVRCLTNKFEKNKNITCKGIAFVEFGNVWSQRTCLDKFHHSMFDDGKSAPRKINVELTAGGGGKTQHRQDKIMEKNKKLDENRAKRIEREKTAKAAGGSGTTTQQQQHMEDSIHPSRRGIVPGAGF